MPLGGPLFLKQGARVFPFFPHSSMLKALGRSSFCESSWVVLSLFGTNINWFRLSGPQVRSFSRKKGGERGVFFVLVAELMNSRVLWVCMHSVCWDKKGTSLISIDFCVSLLCQTRIAMECTNNQINHINEWMNEQTSGEKEEEGKTCSSEASFNKIIS